MSTGIVKGNSVQLTATVAQAQKYKQVMSVIERRVRRGDYLLQPIPGERKLAEETGVSYMTARKAIRGLLESKVLVRRTNGTLDVFPTAARDASVAQAVLLCPAYPSAFLAQLSQTVSDAAEQYGLRIRPVQYVHWDDPIVVNAVNNTAGVFVIPASLDVPLHILESLKQNRGVSLDLNLADQGVPSIRLFPDGHITQTLDYLKKLGHQRIDCISTHVHNPEIERRIGLWREWMAKHKLSGELREHATASFADPMPFAREAMNDLINAGPLRATAFIGTTFPASVGAIRACWDNGLVAGQDVSVCAMNIESPARFMTPAITGLDVPDLSTLLKRCFDWFATSVAWEGPLCMEPRAPRLFQGESTCKSRKSS